jgi:ribosomal protein L34
MFAYSSAVSFVCMKKYADSIEFKKRMDAQNGEQVEPRRRNGRQVVMKRNRGAE